MHIRSIYIGIFFVIILIGIAAHVTWAQSLDSYLADESDAMVRLELVKPLEAVAANQTWWGKIRLLLGIRQVARIKPEIGTKFIVQSSAYASSPYQTDSTPCITAAGTRVRPGVVATNFLPFGTLLDINGQRFIVEDRMNARYAGYFLDIWFPRTSSALEFGRKNLEITIVDYGKPGQEIRTEENDTAKTSEEDEVNANPTIWEQFKNQLANIGELLGARPKGDVDRFDVDCFKEDATAG